MADVLFGDYNPGGHLPVTFPRVTGQVPLVYYPHPTGRPPDEHSPYSSPYVDVHWTPLFPFGHGLSYTTFSHGPPRLSAELRGFERLTLRPGERRTVRFVLRPEHLALHDIRMRKVGGAGHLHGHGWPQFERGFPGAARGCT